MCRIEDTLHAEIGCLYWSEGIINYYIFDDYWIDIRHRHEEVRYTRLNGIDIIKIEGSVELAPLLGIADAIVDIVETGTTLKENNLEVIETIVPISARLIANKSSFKFKGEQIEKAKEALSKIVEERAKQ